MTAIITFILKLNIHCYREIKKKNTVGTGTNRPRSTVLYINKIESISLVNNSGLHHKYANYINRLYKETNPFHKTIAMCLLFCVECQLTLYLLSDMSFIEVHRDPLARAQLGSLFITLNGITVFQSFDIEESVSL